VTTLSRVVLVRHLRNEDPSLVDDGSGLSAILSCQSVFIHPWVCTYVGGRAYRWQNAYFPLLPCSLNATNLLLVFSAYARVAMHMCPRACVSGVCVRFDARCRVIRSHVTNVHMMIYRGGVEGEDCRRRVSTTPSTMKRFIVMYPQ